jgi:hypothetical protein
MLFLFGWLQISYVYATTFKTRVNIFFCLFFSIDSFSSSSSFSHVISGEDTRFNEILNRCQVKKSLNLETNMSIAYGADRPITSLKRNLPTENDIKQPTTISSN